MRTLDGIADVERTKHCGKSVAGTVAPLSAISHQGVTRTVLMFCAALWANA